MRQMSRNLALISYQGIRKGTVAEIMLGFSSGRFQCLTSEKRRREHKIGRRGRGYSKTTGRKEERVIKIEK